ncbi:MAG TPA: acetylglutamate kinase [Egibacteraceae bacterium]|nr:acetylglutamate kinase [Egibacteraceae bacterium]
MSSAPMQLTDRTRAAQDKARVLREALPWITQWAGKTLVVKYGGSAMGGDPLAAAFAADVALLRSVGVRIVVVHGGGPQISALSEQLGLQARFVDGRRVTDAATLEAVKMALLGSVNPFLVGLIAAAGASAVGVAGTDGGLILASPAPEELGLVGEVERVNPGVLTTLLDDGAVPVVATIGRDADGAERNINADSVAGAVAVALAAEKLIYLTDVAGLYEDFGTADSTLLSVVGVERLRAMLDAGSLNEGMVPKVRSMVAALDGGVPQAHLLDGRVEHALLLEIFTDEGIGTMVLPGQGAGPSEEVG